MSYRRPELLGCPFCGKKAMRTVWKIDTGWWAKAGCAGTCCGIRPTVYRLEPTKRKALDTASAAWNTRNGKEQTP